MKFASVLLFIAAFVGVSQASVLLKSRQKDAACTCGKNNYTQEDVDEGISAGIDKGVTGRGYPHVYRNYEHIDFSKCSETLYEYPLKSGRAYLGGPPGADRVIYEESGNFCGCITHTGAPSKNGFVPCDYE